ncbi:hypothetical protein HPP92_020150 [Vanilla planifolia]|uniref:Uncharacterized protein n=1 Tax=Vanilla planifolia TaxID=51239 RepID=A0A835UNL0_VANPL|nr:hypothetical protein HPP92_020150 [Vanilla planifolia]
MRNYKRRRGIVFLNAFDLQDSSFGDCSPSLDRETNNNEVPFLVLGQGRLQPNIESKSSFMEAMQWNDLMKKFIP